MLPIKKMLINYNITEATNRDIKYIVIHDTANYNKGAGAIMHYHYFNGGNRNASADYFVDDSNIVQLVDETTHYAWQCGK